MLDLKQADLAKQAPIGIFGIIMILTGSFVNEYQDKSHHVRNMDCINALQDETMTLQADNFTDGGILSSALSSSLVIILPIIPLLVPPFDNTKWQLIASHIVGQTGSFGSSEVARHFIVSPERQFYAKCNLTLDNCIHIINNNTLGDVCKQSQLPFAHLFNSLHGSPDVSSVMVGAGLLAFIISVNHWREKQKQEPIILNNVKNIIKAVLLIVCMFIVTFLVIDCYLRNNHTPSQIMASILYGVFLQALVYGFFKHSKPPQITPPMPVLLKPIVKLK